MGRFSGDNFLMTKMTTMCNDDKDAKDDNLGNEGGYKRTTTLPFGDFHGSDTDPLTGNGKHDPR